MKANMWSLWTTKDWER